ncbi:SAM-dependent methyltransferase [Roseateles sp. BYS180W]|uniref:SAM-dependent methyltransferase n=1 Tax=Roseateles rivi TaxID=3299028 RepID=A0ABW7FSE0_9BURK
MTTRTTTGRLILVPCPLDFGIDDANTDLRSSLPEHNIASAAQLTHWVAENAKSARAFLKRVHGIYPLAKPLQDIAIRELPRPNKGRGSEVQHSTHWQELLQPCLQGQDLGLISEAGMPAIADPGAQLVAQAHQLGIEVQPMSGPCSLLLALAASGLNGQSFAFVGYLPVEADSRTARLKQLEQRSMQEQQTQLIIETPYRNGALLQALLSTLRPGTRLSVSHGLSTEHARTLSGTVVQWRQRSWNIPDKVPAVFGLLG